MTSALWGVLELMTNDDRGEGGVKNCQNGGDVICGCPLRPKKKYTYIYICKDRTQRKIGNQNKSYCIHLNP